MLKGHGWDAHIKIDHDANNPIDFDLLRQVAQQFPELSSNRIESAEVHRTKKGHHLRIWLKDSPRLPAATTLRIQAALNDDPIRQKLNEERVERDEPGWNLLWNTKIINGETWMLEELDKVMSSHAQKKLGASK